MSRREFFEQKRLLDGAGRTASGCDDDGEQPEPLTSSWGVDDIAGCGHPGYGDLCGSCLAADDAYYRSH